MPLVKPRYVPKHRDARPTPLVRAAPRSVVRNTAVFSSVAVAATGLAVAGGLADADLGGRAPTASPAAAGLSQAGTEDGASAGLEERGPAISRADRRDRSDGSRKDRADAQEGVDGSGSDAGGADGESLTGASPREIGRTLLPEYGFSEEQFGCLDALFVSESDWRVDADNPTSSAYGIPQALTEMHDLPADYMTSAESQIRWGLDYIRDSYGSPCSAWEFKQANNWY